MGTTELLLMASTIGQQAGDHLSTWQLIANAGLMVKFVIFVLVLFSVISWAIIGFKFWQLGKSKKESKMFLKSFWAGESLDQVSISTKRFQATPLSHVFRAGLSELEKVRKGRKKEDDESSLVELSRAEMGVDNVRRALGNAATTEMNRLSRFVSFLATTGSTAPFIGLFGTVWGIMNSFQAIGSQKGAGFEVVGAGISEALIATAVGLAAAIPAVVAYNYFLSNLRVIQAELDNFQAEFLNIIERHFMKKQGKRGGRI
jgi:biopolymer transport protein TolQ